MPFDENIVESRRFSDLKKDSIWYVLFVHQLLRRFGMMQGFLWGFNHNKHVSIPSFVLIGLLKTWSSFKKVLRLISCYLCTDARALLKQTLNLEGCKGVVKLFWYLRTLKIEKAWETRRTFRCWKMFVLKLVWFHVTLFQESRRKTKVLHILMTVFINLHCPMPKNAPTSVNIYIMNLGLENMLIEGYISLSQEWSIQVRKVWMSLRFWRRKPHVWNAIW